ncbi:MAG: Sua5/YciO/YrdC/YwlC family protein, partial [Desulfovibrio sp.]|nr:Sua5/YciO/YrdC/YwlC family protein [Desulfovibrio sp.]
DENEARLLESPENPIVLLKKIFFPANPLAASIAPDTNRVGVMLPTTPLHAILLDCLSARGAQAPCLIATSGNSAGEPICLSNREASGKLKDLADGMLFHNRDILVRVDDSVVSVSPLGNPFFFRRARGFAPQPVETREKVSGILGMGAYLKSTFCLTRDNRAFLSQHIGELDSPASREFYEHTLVHMIKLLETEPRLIIRDLHPDFLSSRLGIELARERDLPIYALQHHAAHAFAVLAERKIYEPSIALCLDGSGYGEDGTIQGGEILEADLENASWRRIGGLSCFPMPGGEKAIREPWRLAAALADNRPENIDERKYNIIREMVRKNLNSPLTSSAGRLFDAVSARLGLCAHTSYEGQAAIRLEKVAQDWLDSRSGSVPAPLFSSINARSGKSGLSIDARAIFRAVDNAIKDGRSVGELAAAFHRDLAFVFARVIGELAERRGVKNIILSGGVFNNRILFATLAEELKNRDLSPLAPSLAPAGDGAISLGQAAFGQRLAALGKIALK